MLTFFFFSHFDYEEMGVERSPILPPPTTTLFKTFHFRTIKENKKKKNNGADKDCGP
jgi:hypothetical protein